MKQLLLILAVSYLLTACHTTAPDATKEIEIDNLPAACPYLTTDAQQHEVLSWVRLLNDSTTALCYQVFDDNKPIAPVINVPHTDDIQPHGENMPKLIFKPDGAIIALWGIANGGGKNKYAGLVLYSQSFDGGKQWTTPAHLVTDTNGYDQRYYDVALLPNGEAGIIWLDNRKTTKDEGSALYFASTKGKAGFGAGKLISEHCCQCCRTSLYVDRSGNIHALYRSIIQDSIRDMVHMVSTDGANSFSQPQRISADNWVISGCPHTGPAMTENKNGLHFAWFTGAKDKGCYYTSSIDNGKTFIHHQALSTSGTHPQIAAVGNDKLLVVWEEAVIENNAVSKRIACQLREEGKVPAVRFLTNEKEEASYPVVRANTKGRTMVAYLKKRGGKDFVNYQWLDDL